MCAQRDDFGEFDRITAERRRLYGTGLIRLERRPGQKDRMVPVDRASAEGWATADLYNALADRHLELA